MKKITTVLFDLDGTLLPMDQEVFVKAYFGSLAKKLAPHGYDPQTLIAGIWEGIAAMVKNDGSKTAEEAFWASFADRFGAEVRKDEPLFDEYYRNEFSTVQQSCGFTPKAAEVIAYLKGRGFRLALLTNPIFPAVATEARIRWAGLNKADFELVTTYENSRFCKPNPAYYAEALEKLGCTPEECLMVGNDATEDLAAATLGIPVFLLTNDLINKKEADISAVPRGDYEDLLAYLKTI